MKKLINLILSITICICCSVEFGSFTTIKAEGEPGIAMHRMYNMSTGEHFYTASVYERDALVSRGWKYEGIGWYAPSEGDPVYRLYNVTTGDHHYTTSPFERDALAKLDWNDEGIGWYSDPNHTVPLYRQYNPRARVGSHNYTASKFENDHLVSIGWKAEGVGWYAVADSSYVKTPDVPVFYSQLDSRWSNIKFNGYTFGSTGCGVTGIAMIMSGKLHREILPPDVGKVLCDRGQYNNLNPATGSLGTTGTSRIVAGEYYGVPCTLIGMDDYNGFVQALSDNKIMSIMVQGKPFTSDGTHGIVVYNYSDGAVSVLDPNQGIANGRYSVSDVWAHRSFDKLDLDAGTTVFAF